MRSLRTLALSGAALLAISAQAHAAGFYLQEQSVVGTGRAYSGEVADQGPASLWWNPASIASSPREAYVGVSGVLVSSKVTNDNSTIRYPGGVTLPVSGVGKASDPIQSGVAPSFAISTPIGDRFAVGVSLTAPYNFTTKYDRNSWARYDALDTRLTTTDLQLTGAMKATDWLDLGVGVDAEYTNAKLQTASPNLSPLLPDGVNQLSGDGWNYGYTLGAQAHVDRWSLGASYRSAMAHDLHGHLFVGGLLGPLAGANAVVDGSANFTTPWIATVGARYRLTDKLTLDGQIQRFGWSEFDAIDIRTAAGSQSLAQNYKDTTTGAVGVDYALNPKLTLRAGVQYDPTPTPGAERTARVPDSNRWLLSAGATAQVTPAIKVDAAVSYIDFANSSIHHDSVFYGGTPAAVATALRGGVEGQGLVLAVGMHTAF
ncbi:OmpP1/FadL family transporter [Phenylobacterium sp.]|jgi:long-chain fatty acid transport protein|uniref:OmpP1/FadL family transporter n=1 Tax=Phenylobacterium sp. TaxID=1871053 RepID=UPI002E335BD9|nr:outer membrane protein transport protein [Phenylobacterium sp.]HEX3365401.1 outer membrane protein transport protein [Phenylobacterium sp.]